MLTAFSTARRARVRRFSSTGSSVPPASIDSRSRMIARSANSSAMASRRPRISSNSPAMERLREQFEWVTDVEAGDLQVEDAARVGAGPARRASAANGLALPRPELARHVGMDDVVGAARPAAKALVVELEQVGVR